MYRVGVQREFIAQHYLIGGDWGAENQLHSHPYRLELELSGRQLDQRQYLVDIVAIEDTLDRLIGYFRDHTLNDLAEQFLAGPVERISVKLWENAVAWAGYEVGR